MIIPLRRRAAKSVLRLRWRAVEPWRIRSRAQRSTIPTLLTTGSLDPKILAEQLARYKSGDTTVQPIVADLVADAERRLEAPPVSVMDKTSVAESGDPHDYLSPAPYWWPDPDSADGLPYVRRDGERVPGAEICSPESEKYDRTALSVMTHDAYVCALAGYFTGDDRYFERAATAIRTWFLDPATRMNAEPTYAQVRAGHPPHGGSSAGVVDFAELYLVIDAAALMESQGALNRIDATGFRVWLARYYSWLVGSNAGRTARFSSNNRATWHGVESLAILSFLGAHRQFFAVVAELERQIPAQFEEDGSQPGELERVFPLHYTGYNLQAWIAALSLVDLAGVASRPGWHAARKAVAAGLSSWAREARAPSAAENPEVIGEHRISIGWHLARARGVELGSAAIGSVTPVSECRLLGSSEEAIPPYWPLGRVEVPSYA